MVVTTILYISSSTQRLLLIAIGQTLATQFDTLGPVSLTGNFSTEEPVLLCSSNAFG